MTFVRNGNENLPDGVTAETQASLLPIAPPYVSTDHHGDRAFETPQSQPLQSGLNPFPGWKRDDDEFRVDL